MNIIDYYLNIYLSVYLFICLCLFIYVSSSIIRPYGSYNSRASGHMVSLIAVFQTISLPGWDGHCGNDRLSGCFPYTYTLLITQATTFLWSGLSSVGSIFAIKCRPISRTAFDNGKKISRYACNKSAFSFLLQQSTWHCPHLLLRRVMQQSIDISCPPGAQ